MNPFSPEYNKKNNEFMQGISRIRNKNNNFFENTRHVKSIHNLADINTYFTIVPGMEQSGISFRKTNPLPAAIEAEIQSLFDRVWGTTEAGA
jgi:hypothetical protein